MQSDEIIIDIIENCVLKSIKHLTTVIFMRDDYAL